MADQLDDDGTGHSPIHGFAYDGFPIFGPYQAADTLAVSCWAARNYSSSETGCSGGERTCLLTDPFDYTQGTTSTSYEGPLLNSTVTSQSGNAIYVTSGSYFEDFYYNSSCYAQGGVYLDSHNGHDHDGIGYHYHLTMDSDGVPTFPYAVGPKYYGCLPSSSQSCGTSYLYGANIFGVDKYATGTSTCGGSEAVTSYGCSGYSFSADTSSVSPSRAPSRTPTVKPSASGPTAKPSGKPSSVPTMAPSNSRAPTNTLAPTNTNVPTCAPTIAPSNQVSAILSFDTTMSLTGLTSNTLDVTAQTAIITAAANVMVIDEDNIAISDVTISSLRQRRLAKIGLVATYSASVTLTVEINTVDYFTTNATAVYTSLSSSLSSAQQNGNFATYIRTAATTLGASTLSAVSVSSLSVSAVSVINPPTYAPSGAPSTKSSNSTSLAIIIGAAAGGFALIVILIAMIYFCCCKKSPTNPQPSAPVAYGKVSRDDKLEVVVAVAEVKL